MTNVEAYLMELVCHTRWLANFLLTQVDDTVLQRYPRDVESAKQALYSLSKTHSFVDSIAQIPESVVATLSEGALYLLCAEVVLGHCPPTMHQFLQQTILQREQSSTQSQLLLLRWLLTAQLLQIDEMVDMVFDNGKALEDFTTDYDAHIAIAGHLAQSDPFFLGAHVLIVRGLLLHFCSETLQGDDVLSHVQLLSPPGSSPSPPPLHTIEDALLLWMRTVLSLFSADSVDAASPTGSRTRLMAAEVRHVDDLYLHTNDGRVIALVVHHYQPDLLPLSQVHLETPLSVWQRQDNWTSIIRATEALGIWVGVFADELVAHGFSTLQLHVLRLVQELFLVLASGAEEKYEVMRRQVAASSAASAANTSQQLEGEELEGDTTFVKPNVLHSVMLPPGGAAPVSGLANYEPFYATHEGTVFDDGSQSRERLFTASTAPPNSARTAPEEIVTEDQLSPEEHEPSDHDLSQEQHLHGGEENFNIVMTGLFLQGVSLPIRRQPLPEEEHRTDADQSTTTATILTTTAAPPTLSLSSVHEPVSAVPQHSVSPVRNSRSSVDGLRRSSHQSAVASSLAHFKDVRQSLHASRPGASVVQGSMDSEGMQKLLEELAGVGQSLAHDDPRAAVSTDGLREQNTQLKLALQEQQRRVQEMLLRLRAGLSKHEFSAIVKCLTPGQGSGAVALRQRSNADPLRISYAAVGTQVSCDWTQQQLPTGSPSHTLTKLRSSLDALRGSRTQLPPGRLVVSGAGKSVDTSAQQPNVASSLVGLVTSPLTKVGGSDPPLVTSKGGVALQFSFGDLKKSMNPRSEENTTKLLKSGAAKKHTVADAAASSAPVELASLASLRQRAAQKTASTAAASRAPVDVSSPAVAVDDGSCSTPQSLANTVGATSSSSALYQQSSAANVAPVQIKVKSNKAVMTLAFKHVLLTGTLNKANLDKVLKIITDATNDDNNQQFVVSFKDEFTQQFRGLYVVKPDGMLHRVYGVGPLVAYAGPQPQSEAEAAEWTQGQPYLFPKFFKFDSGSKAFQLLPSKWVNQAADGVAFAAAKPKVVDRDRW